MKEINLKELNFEIEHGDMNGVLYDDENREVATKKPILQVKGLTNNTTGQLWPDDGVIRPKTSKSGLKIDSWDRPDTLPPVEPFYIERYEDKKNEK